MKQTAVEYLQQHFQTLINNDERGLYKLLFEQAKEMEKERIIKTYEVGISRGINYDEDVYHKNNWRSGEQYYNETFKSE
jgi:hypothetical protein